MWQLHSTNSKLRAPWKSTKELAASKATMNIKYWLHFSWPLSILAVSTAMFAGRLLGLTDKLRTILWDLKDHLVAWSSFKLTSRMRTSSEPSQEQSIQNGRLCAYLHVFSYHKFTQKFFVCLIVAVNWTNNTKLFPIYETSKIKPEDPSKSMSLNVAVMSIQFTNCYWVNLSP